MTTRNQFIFILNYLEPQVTLPIEIVDGYWLKRPDAEQLDIIKDFLRKNVPESGMKNYSNIYEQSFNYVQEETKSELRFTDLTEENQKYFIIENETGSKSNLEDIVSSCELSKFSLHIGVKFIFGNSIYQSDHSSIFSFFDQSKFDSYLIGLQISNAHKINVDDINEIKEIYKLLASLDTKFSYLKSMIKNYINVQSLPSDSKFKTLGYFSILESLITHEPKDSGDSIAKQLYSKIILINNQLGSPIDFKSLFKMEIKASITKLYDYRSSITHGKYDYTIPLELKNDHYVCSSIALIVRRIIVYTLQNPQLINDLKSC